MAINKCPNCDVEFSSASVTDVPAGDVLITIDVEYCSECLYVNSSNITLSN